MAGLVLFASGAAKAKVDITVDKNNQMMTGGVDGAAWEIGGGWVGAAAGAGATDGAGEVEDAGAPAAAGGSCPKTLDIIVPRMLMDVPLEV